MKDLKSLLSYIGQLSLWLKVMLLLCFLPGVLALYLLYSQSDKMVVVQLDIPIKKAHKQLVGLGISSQIDGEQLRVVESQKKLIEQMFAKTEKKQPKYYEWLFRDSFFETGSKRELKAHYSREKKLESMINRMPIVQSCMVQLSIPPRRVFARDRKPAKAAVSLVLESEYNQLSPEKVHAIAHTVAAASVYLEPKNVNIIANGNFYSLENVTVEDKKHHFEEYYRIKLLKAFSHLPVLNISVSLDEFDPTSLIKSLRITLTVQMKKDDRKTVDFSTYTALAQKVLAPIIISDLQVVRVSPAKEKEPQPQAKQQYPWFLPMVWATLLMFVFCLFWVRFPRRPSLSELDMDAGDPLGRRQIMTFEEIRHISDRVLSRALTEVDKKILSHALKVAPPKIKKKIFRSLPRADRDALHDEMKTQGPVRLGSVEAAQREIIDLVNEVNANGKG